jgi:hypothetical protein
MISFLPLILPRLFRIPLILMRASFPVHLILIGFIVLIIQDV